MSAKILLGKPSHHLLKELVLINQKDLNSTFVFGDAYSNASEMTTSIMLDLMDQTEGMIVFDFEDEFNDNFLSKLPPVIQNKIQVFDPTHTEKIPGLNLFNISTNETKTVNWKKENLAIDKFYEVIDSLYDLKSTGGPMFEAYFRNLFRLTISHHESGDTIATAISVMQNEDLRVFKLAMCEDREVVKFWEKEVNKSGGDSSLVNMTPYINTKLHAFIQNKTVFGVVSQPKTTIDFASVFNNGGILLVRLNSTKIGVDSREILFKLFIAQLELVMNDISYEQNNSKVSVVIKNMDKILDDMLTKFITRYSERLRLVFYAKSPDLVNNYTNKSYQLLKNYLANEIVFRNSYFAETKDFSDDQALFDIKLNNSSSKPILLSYVPNLILQNMHQKGDIVPVDLYIKKGMSLEQVEKLVSDQDKLLF